MGYKIPAEKEVASAIKAVLKKFISVSSQRRLKRLVSSELACLNPSYKVSQKRARLVAIKSGIANIEIHAKEGAAADKFTICPVCFSRLIPIKNKTLYNWEVTLGYKCRKCSYWSGRKIRMPVRYVFRKK